MCDRKVILLVIVFAIQANGLTDDTNSTKAELATEKNVPENTKRAERSLHKECSIIYSSECIKVHVLSFLEDLNSRDDLELLPGLSIVKENVSAATTNSEEMAAEISKQFPGKSAEKLNGYLMHRLRSYLDGHSLRFKLLDQEIAKEAMDMAKSDASIGRKRGGGGGKGGGSALLAAALMAKGALAAAALGALGILAGKALMAALLSLLLSALIGLKGHGGHKSTTYEIITKPEISHHHSQSHEEHHEHAHGHHGGYKRNYDIGYNSYMPYQITKNS